MSVADLEHLANVQYPVSGDLSANLSMHGSRLDPAGSGTITIANARAYDEPIQTFDAKFEASSGTITSTLNVAIPAGSARSSLTYTPRTKAYKVRLDAPAIVLEKVHTLEAKNAGMKGTLSLTASGEGTIDDPRLDAVLDLPKLEVRDKSIAGLKAQINVANQRANLVLDSQVAQASVRARGQVELTGDYQADASIDTGSIPLEGLAAAFATTVPEGFKGMTELHATLKGPLKDTTRIEAHLSIPTLNASYQQFQIGAASPIRADFANSIVTIQPAEIKGTGTTLRVQGKIPVAGASSATLVAQGSIDARILRIFQADLHSSGTVSLDVRATGTPQDPSVQGQIGIHDIALNTPDAPVAIDKLNGTLDLSKDRLQISGMSAQVGGGQLSIGGSVAYRPSLQFNVALQGNSIRLRYPDGLRTVFDSNLAFTGNLQASSLNGRVLVDSLSFTPDFDLSTFSDQFASNEATPSQPGFADTVNLAIAVQSKENLSATSSQVSMEGRMNLRVGGTAANPVITGRTDLTAGELFYRNVRYQLQRGVITFDNPNQTNPNLNVSVGAKVQQYDVTINLRGPLDKLTSSYTSDPPLATADIINLVAFGKTTSQSAASSSSQSTDSMLAQGAIGSGLSSGVQKLAGISSLQIDPTLGGNNQNLSARIALQQRVTKNFLFTFSTDVSQPGDEIVQGEYQINKRWSVSMSRDQLGGVSVDGRFHTQF
jgi:translocation and assembly module TamB